MPHHTRAEVPQHGQAPLHPPALVLPHGAVTGIGSLPFRDPHTAVQWVAQTCPRLPFWPELPRRSPHARSVEQTFGAFADLVCPRSTGSGYEVVPGQLAALLERLEQAPARLEPARSAGFFAFEQAMAAGQFAHAVAVKGQLIGPLTLAWQLWAEGIPLVTLPEYRAAIGRYLRRLAHWQLDRLAQWGKPVLFFLDEPCLGWLASLKEMIQEELVAVLHDLLGVLRRPGVLLGVHTCARLSPGGVALGACGRVRPDVISFDAYQGLEVFCADPAAQDFLRTGGWVAWGLIPTWPRLDQLDPQALCARWLGAATGVMAVEALARQTLITATCGLGLLPASAVARSFHLAHQLAQRIAQVAQATTEAETA